MKIFKQTWFSHLISMFVVFLCCVAIYMVSQKIDYNWQWERVVPYIIDVSPEEITSPFDGTVKIENSIIHVVSDDGDDAFVIELYDETSFNDLDLVYAGDVVATVNEWRFGLITKGMMMTIYISFFSLIFAIIIGLVVGILRTTKNVIAMNLTTVYIEIIRGTPLLVQIFIFYFFIGTVLDLDRMTAGIAALSIFSGAYIAEIVRSGIQSIPQGQTEGAKSLGLSYLQTMRLVILPQAIRKTLPPMVGQFINLVKDSSLVSVIAITDLTKAGREVASATFSPFEVWFTIALCYLLLTGILSFALQRFERSFRKTDR